MPPPTPLSLEGLAAVLERHIEQTSHLFQRVEEQIGGLTDRLDTLSHRVEDLAGQMEGLVGLHREQGLRITALAEQQAEQRMEIRQILHRLEQNDARFEEHSRRLDEHGLYIRRMLDLLERRGEDGGPPTA
jgi:septal ring factor EnvC (AmiA/AmiB activator)